MLPAAAVAAGLTGLVALILLGIQLPADPAIGVTASDSPFTDEGWYVLGARNLALLGRLATDDWQLAWATLPFTLVVSAAFEILDVGIVQARVVSVVCSVAMVAMVAALLTRRLGTVAGIVAGIATASSSLMLFYGRLAILEPMVALFLTAGVVLLLSHATDRPVVRGVAAGAALRTGDRHQAIRRARRCRHHRRLHDRGPVGRAGAPPPEGRCRRDHRGRGSRVGDRRDPATGRARLDPAHLGRPGRAGLGDRRLATRRRLRRRVRPSDPHDRAPPDRLGARDRPRRGSAGGRSTPAGARSPAPRLAGWRSGWRPLLVASYRPSRYVVPMLPAMAILTGFAVALALERLRPARCGRGGGDRRALHRRRTPGRSGPRRVDGWRDVPASADPGGAPRAGDRWARHRGSQRPDLRDARSGAGDRRAAGAERR